MTGDGVIPAHVKLPATLGFVIAVVVTPPGEYWAFGLYAALLAAAAIALRVPRSAWRRLAVELPFVLYALVIPLVGRGPRVAVGPLSLSEPGLLAAWSVLAKATLGVGAAVVLSASTPADQLLSGLARWRVPRRLVAIAGFMVRYGDVLGDELRRLRIARTSRLDDPRWPWQARAAARSLGVLFVRSYERGERVYLAMLSRGYSGAMPDRRERATPRHWAVAMTGPVTAGLVAVAAVVR